MRPFSTVALPAKLYLALPSFTIKLNRFYSKYSLRKKSQHPKLMDNKKLQFERKMIDTQQLICDSALRDALWTGVILVNSGTAVRRSSKFFPYCSSITMRGKNAFQTRRLNAITEAEKTALVIVQPSNRSPSVPLLYWLRIYFPSLFDIRTGASLYRFFVSIQTILNAENSREGISNLNLLSIASLRLFLKIFI